MTSDPNLTSQPSGSQPIESTTRTIQPTIRPTQFDASGFWWTLISGSALVVMLSFVGDFSGFRLWPLTSWFEPQSHDATPVPLVMQGGDPYIRALMRTISASESNGPRPYSLLYGGEHIRDLSYHPDYCVPIVAGPNIGDCTTAAGRYQMLTTTWEKMAHRYHPQRFLFWSDYSFAPEFQDQVVYRWLKNPDEWGADLSQLLRDGQIHQVLEILSPTWTSLGYGIEPNSMTSALPDIYEEMLQEELGSS